MEIQKQKNRERFSCILKEMAQMRLKKDRVRLTMKKWKTKMKLMRLQFLTELDIRKKKGNFWLEKKNKELKRKAKR